MQCFEPLWKAVESELTSAGHNLSHVRRVFWLAQTIAQREGDAVNWKILGAAAILHDIARVREDTDPTRSINHAILGAEMAQALLLAQGWASADALWVAECIRSHRFRTNSAKPATLEAKILFDSDKLDCLGAVGIARSFMMAGEYGEPLYISPNAPQEANVTADGLLQDLAKHAPNVEYEVKFRKIPANLFTDAAKAIAKERMQVMDDFFVTLAKELGDA